MTASIAYIDRILAALTAPAPSARPTLDATAAPAQTARMDAADQQDISACLNGRPSVYAEIVRRHQARIARHLHRFTRDPGELEELTQETFVQAFAGLKSFRGDSALESWLLTIATRAGYRFWKQRSRTAAMAASTQELEAIADRGAAEESGEALAALLNQLPPRDRLVLMLLYVEQNSVAETAKRAGWSKTMVKVQAFRARGKLKKILLARQIRSEVPR